MTLRLHYNENPAGCSAAVLHALAGLTVHDIAEYADDTKAASAIARWFNVSEDWVLPVNGLDEGLLLAAQLAASSSWTGYEGLIVEPAFDMYAAVIASTGGTVRRLAPQADFRFDVSRTIASVSDRTRLLFLCDPNNPTGLGLRRSDIEAVADALPQSLVVVDEAYADFSGRSMIDAALERRPNVIVGRTFAKAHGLAGLRIGALIAAPETIANLRRLALPYRINIAATVALEAALLDRAHFAQSIAEAASSRTVFMNECRRLGLRTWPSEANFVLVRIDANATDCARWMAARGVRVRDRSALPGCDGCLRITTGSTRDAAIAASLLEEWYASQPR